MPTVAPVPAATMRSGRTALAPVVVTRTGRMSWTDLPGTSLIARKSNFSATYLSTTGCTSAGTLNPLVWSHCSSAFASVALSCTVSYGPTTSCFVTTTPDGGAAASDAAEPAWGELNELRLQDGGDGQLRGGATMLVRVMPSSVE